MFIFNWRIIALQYCVGFCRILTWISHRYTHVLSLLNLPPTLHHIPHFCYRAPSLSSPCHTANSHQLSILCMVMYIFQCSPLDLYHRLLPPLCPQVCSLCVHLHSCLGRRFISITFLDSIYALIYGICLSLSDLLHSV